MPSFDIELPLPPQGLSPNARVHWAQKAQWVRQYKEECGWTLVALKRSVAVPKLPLWPPVKATVTFTLSSNRRRDLDNWMAMLKPLWDAMVETGWLVDDSADKLRFGEPSMDRYQPAGVRVRLEWAESVPTGRQAGQGTMLEGQG